MAGYNFQAPQLGSGASGIGSGGGQVGGVNTAGDALTGNQNNPGLLGTGQYVAPGYNINQNAFANPAGNQGGNLNNILGGYIQNAGAGVNAASSQYVQPTNYNTAVQGQLGLANQFGQMALGQGPSAATVAANQQGAANLAANESMLGSARGAGNPAQAQLAARNAAATGQQQIAQNVVAGKTNEELGAMNAQAGLLGTIGSQGLQSQAQQLQNQQFNAGQANQIAQGNQANTANAYGQVLGSLQSQDLAQLNANMAGQQLGVQNQLGLDQIQQQSYANAAKNNQSAIGGLMSGIGGAVGGLL